MKWKKSWQIVNSAENFKKNFIKTLSMTRDDMNSIEIIVETKKFFVTDEKNALFAMINFKKNEWLNIDLNDNLNKIVNNKRKRFEKTSVVMSSLSLIFIKLIHNAKLLWNFMTLKQMTYSKIENRYAKVKIIKIEKKKKKLIKFLFISERKKICINKMILWIEIDKK